MSTYLQVPTRTGVAGAMDKAAIIQALSVWTAQTNRDFIQLVRDVVKNCQTAESQVQAWFLFCCSRTYSRELGDMFANPADTAIRGGDCDDLTILCLAGLHSLGIPACPDVILRTDPETGTKHGVHVRVRCGLPPNNPPADGNKWLILDPSRESEKRWVDAKGDLYAPKMKHITSGALAGNLGNYNSLGDSAKVINTKETTLDKVEREIENIGWKPIVILGTLALGLFAVRSYFQIYRKDQHMELIPAFRE